MTPPAVRSAVYYIILFPVRPMSGPFRLLRETLREYGIEDIFSMKSGAMRIVPEKISCDAYRLFSGDPDAVNSFHGTYMNSYPWASVTEGYLSWKVFGGESHPSAPAGMAGRQDKTNAAERQD